MVLSSRRRGAAQSVVDRTAKTAFGNGRDGDDPHTTYGGVKIAQGREQRRGGLGHIAAGGQVD
jgi:hypothetical protein